MAKRKIKSAKFERLRARAEELLQKADNTDQKWQSTRELLHELQVHQIELEVQNEELEQVHDQLEASRNRYQRLYDYAPVGYFILDNHGLIKSVNLTFAAMLQRQQNRLNGKTFAPLLAESSRKRYFGLFGADIHNETEVQMMRPDGSKLWVLLKLDAVFDTTGQTEEYWGTITDISAQHEVEEALREKDAELARRLEEIEAAYDHAHVGLCAIDANYVYMRVNERMAEFNHHPVQEHAGRLFWEMAPVAKIQVLEIGEKIKETLKPVLNMEMSTANGSEANEQIFLTHWYPLKQNDTSLAGLTIVFEDITPQKRLQRKLYRETTFLKSITDTIPVMIVIWNEQENALRLNEQCKRLLGYSEEILPLQEMLEAALPDAEYRHVVLEHFEKPSPRWQEIKVTTRDGIVIDTLWTYVALSPAINVGIGLDNRENKEAKRELLEVQAGLEQRVAERTKALQQRNQELKRRSQQLQLLATQLNTAEQEERRRLSQVLHDNLQQLLGVVKINLGLLRKAVANNSQAAETLKQTDAIIGEALNFIRTLSYELFPPVLHTFGLPATLEWLADLMLEKYKCRVSLEVSLNGCTLDRPMQEFLYLTTKELLYNVVKHAHVEMASLSLSVENNRIVLEVSDAGAGFDPSKSRWGAGSNGGFGLLSIRERAGYLGGRMTINSDPGKGSVFVISLPLKPAAKETRPAAGSDGESSPVQMGKTPLRVLLVDDHKIMREGLRSLLAHEHDLEVVGEADNGETALAQAHTRNPDLIIMDVSMPVMDGLAATQRIKGEFPRMHIIGLTMFEEEPLRKKMVEAGAIACLPKNGPSQDLLTVIEHCRHTINGTGKLAQ